MAKLQALLLFALFACSFAYRFIDLPNGTWNLTNVDNADKNAGIAEADESVGDGDVHLGPPGNKKGDHLASAAAYLRAYNSTLADEIQSTAGVPATTGQSTYHGGGVTALWGEMSSGLNYFGGQLMTAKQGNIYIVWYGSWTPAQKQPFRNFISSLGQKNPSGKSVPTVRDWWAINAKNYYDSKKNYVSGDIVLAGEYSDKYSAKPKGTKANRVLQRTDLQKILKASFSKGLKFDPNGAYFVLTSKDVYVDTFCSSTCSYHSFFTHNGKKVAFSFVGDSTTQCQVFCTYQYMDPSAVTRNGLGVDGMISMFAHELAGLFTNPFQGGKSSPGWVVAGSQIENADLCSWIFGDELQWSAKAPHYVHNVVGLGGSKFIIQQNFNFKTQSCEMRYKVKA